jgi:hypothetical protein
MMPEDELKERQLALGRSCVQALAQMQADGMADWLGAVHRLSELGQEADRLLADFYDAMTPEELEADFGNGEEVAVGVSPDLRVSFACRFTRPELAEVRRWDGEHYPGDVAHDAALSYIREADGVRIALAKLKGSEPTRAEILSGLTLRAADDA